jgi:hypothetical protein
MARLALHGVLVPAEPQHAQTAGSGCVGGRKLSWIALALSGSPCRGRAAGARLQGRYRHAPPNWLDRACDIAHPVSRYRFTSEATALAAQARAAASALEQQRGYVVRRLAALSMIVPSERLPKVV